MEELRIFKTRLELAKELGKHYQTIRSWEKKWKLKKAYRIFKWEKKYIWYYI